MKTKLNIDSLDKIHFIGIGGSGLSALAGLLSQQGKKVAGSDLSKSANTDSLENVGIKIKIGEHQRTNITPGTDLVIHTVAIESDNPELQQAEKLNIPTVTYPEFIGELTKENFTIAVAGTHGKTTTTAMIGVMMEAAGLDPTVIVGSRVEEFAGNVRLGKSKYLVLEADEYRRAFWHYHCEIAVILNIEFDHPDCYEDLDDVENAFAKFSAQAKQVIRDVDKIENDLGLELQLPGEHYLHDALAAQQVGRMLGIEDDIIKKSLESYQGSTRRFEKKGEFEGATVIDDYAHHPTEIKATLQGARQEYPEQKIIAVFQPHHQERTQQLYSDFVRAFAEADKLIVTDIYQVAGRKAKVSVSGEKLAGDIAATGVDVKYMSMDKIVDYLSENVKKGDVILIMGAGDITIIADKLAT